MRNLTTPRLVLDEDVLARNIAKAATRFAGLGVALRPHLKSHKCVEIMALQLEAGACGVTVATIHEAEIFSTAGARDLLIAYPPVGRWRLERLLELTAEARIIVACAESEQVRELARLGRKRGRPFEYYWEIDCGAGRLGTLPGDPTASALEPLSGLSGARLAGIMTFPGHSYRAKRIQERRAIAREEGRALAETKSALERRAIDAGVLSGGSTPTAWLDDGKDTVDEYRCGNYVFLDATQVALGTAIATDCALAVAAAVVGRPAADRVILDAGSKALAAEAIAGVTEGLGIVRDHPELRVAALYEEHAICHVVDGECPLRVGDEVEVVPNHACVCANLHEAYAVRQPTGGEERWPIAARGWT